MKSIKPKLSPLLGLFLGVVAVSAASIFIRFAQKEAPSLVIAAYRLILAAIILMPMALMRNKKEIGSLNRKTKSLLLLSGIFLAIHFGTWVTSLEYTTVISSVVLVTTAPLWVALFSIVIFRKKDPTLLYFGLGIALLGSVIIGSGQVCAIEAGKFICPHLSDITKSRSFTGNTLALIGALTAAGYIIIGKLLRSYISLLTYTFIVYGISGIILGLSVLISNQKSFGFSISTYIFIIALAIIPQLIGHTSFNWALKFLSATYVAVATLGEPVGSTILAYFLLGEIPHGLEIAGGVIILVGIYIATKNEQTT